MLIYYTNKPSVFATGKLLNFLLAHMTVASARPHVHLIRSISLSTFQMVNERSALYVEIIPRLSVEHVFAHTVRTVTLDYMSDSASKYITFWTIHIDADDSLTQCCYIFIESCHIFIENVYISVSCIVFSMPKLDCLYSRNPIFPTRIKFFFIFEGLIRSETRRSMTFSFVITFLLFK